MDLLATYLVEAEELLAAIEEITLDLGPNSDPEQLNGLFRAFHTLKGSSATVGLTEIADTRFVVLEVPIDGEPCVIGARTDSVHDVMELAASDIEPPRSLGRRWRTDVLRGIARRGDEFVLVIDVAQLFVDDKALLQDQGTGAEAVA